VVDAPKAHAPSAYVLNLRASSLLVTEFLNFVARWRPLATVCTERWRAGTTERWDRANLPETAQADCAICGMRIGTGSSFVLPRMHAAEGMQGASMTAALSDSDSFYPTTFA
jgi:hypothetical protein